MQLDQKIFEEKVGSKWYKYIHRFFTSKEAYDIYQVIKSDAGTDFITPASEDTWKFLKNSDPDNIKVLMLLTDSYSGCYTKPTKYKKGLFHSTGIPLDCSNTPDGKIQGALTEFWNGISAELNDDLPKEKSLQFLIDQGLFLGNRGITCKLFKGESHIPLWDYFWQVFFEDFVSQHPNIPIIFCGKVAEKLKRFVAFNPIYTISHPSAAAKTGQVWNTENVFTKCNKRIKDMNGPEYQIEYNYHTYSQPIETMDELPF
jgi:uracil DNA glycosylase